MSTRYLVFDKETETHHSFKRKSNPFDPRNYVVMRGWKKEGDKQASWQYFESKADVTPMEIPDDVGILVGHNIKFDLLYEMCVSEEARNHLMTFFNRGGKIWDTQYAEYLLLGQVQSAQMVAMDTIAEKYGGRTKIDGIKVLWEQGVLTSEINRDMLTDYLVGTEDEDRNSGDIGNTELIYLGQIKQAKLLGMFSALERRMDGLLATTEMEFNGLKIDFDVAKEEMTTLVKEKAIISERLNEFIKGIPDEVGFKWTSNVHVSCLLFGGTIKYKKQDTYIDEATGELARYKAKEAWPLFNGQPINATEHTEWSYTKNGIGRRFRITEDGIWVLDTKPAQTRDNPNPDVLFAVRTQDTFKSGKRMGEPKFKQVDVQGELKVKYQEFYYTLPRITEPEEHWKGALVDGHGGPIYSTDKETIKELSARNVPFIQDYARNAALEKELGTYFVRYDPKKKQYVGMLTAVDPQTGIVHHSLNHVNTVTTRLSSNNPNLQNLPRADKSRMKRMFVSRFGKDGVMGELDYSQLEVVVQGLLSGDKQLIEDLIKKIDFHCKRVAMKTGCTYEEALYRCKDEGFEDFKEWKAIRTKCKEFSFQRAYGAGAAAISGATGVPKEDIELMIRVEEQEYPGITDFNNKVADEVNRTAEGFRDWTREGEYFRRGTYQAPTGTIYTFRSYPPMDWMVKKGITDTFKPTEMKNYPIQGTGGEIVQMVAGMLVRLFYKTNNFGGKAFLVNTVHDCYWIDMHKDVVDVVMPKVLQIMQMIPQFLQRFYGIHCPVPFPADAETGPNMYDLHHYSSQ